MLQARELCAGWRRPTQVLAQINGAPTSPATVNMMRAGGGSFYLYLHGSIREASGTGVGDWVEVAIAFDEAYASGPQHRIPDALMAESERCPEALHNW